MRSARSTQRYLTDRCVRDIEVDRHGNAWVAATAAARGEVLTLEGGRDVQTVEPAGPAGLSLIQPAAASARSSPES